MIPGLPSPVGSYLYVPGALLAVAAVVTGVVRGGRKLLHWLRDQGNAEALRRAEYALDAANLSLRLARETASNWQSYAESQAPLIEHHEARIAELEARVTALQAENARAVAAATHLELLVAWLRAKVGRLEGVLRHHNLDVPPDDSPEPRP